MTNTVSLNEIIYFAMRDALLANPDTITLPELAKVAVAAMNKPVSVSLEKCVSILKLNNKEYETNEDMAKAVLDAAGVVYAA